MAYILEQKLLSIGNDFSVYDEGGALVYYFDGRVLSFPKKTVIQSATGSTEGVLRRKLFAIRSAYTLTINNRLVATIARPFFAFRRGVSIVTPQGRIIKVIGRVLEHDYTFQESGRPIASVSKKWFRGRDTYSVEVQGSADDLLILSATVVIDLLFHPKRDSSFNN